VLLSIQESIERLSRHSGWNGRGIELPFGMNEMLPLRVEEMPFEFVLAIDGAER
jgi:hypothetical protein